MGKAEKKQQQKADFELLFKDSPDYFLVKNAKMLQEGDLIRFICFDDKDKYDCDQWFPLSSIHRIKRYAS